MFPPAVIDDPIRSSFYYYVVLRCLPCVPQTDLRMVLAAHAPLQHPVYAAPLLHRSVRSPRFPIVDAAFPQYELHKLPDRYTYLHVCPLFLQAPAISGRILMLFPRSRRKETHRSQKGRTAKNSLQVTVYAIIQRESITLYRFSNTRICYAIASPFTKRSNSSL